MADAAVAAQPVVVQGFPIAEQQGGIIRELFQLLSASPDVTQRVDGITAVECHVALVRFNYDLARATVWLQGNAAAGAAEPDQIELHEAISNVLIKEARYPVGAPFDEHTNRSKSTTHLVTHFNILKTLAGDDAVDEVSNKLILAVTGGPRPPPIAEQVQIRMEVGDLSRAPTPCCRFPWSFLFLPHKTAAFSCQQQMVLVSSG